MKIGQIFKYKGRKLITVEQRGCVDCFLDDIENDKCKDMRFKCASNNRKDKKGVIFKLLPFKFGQ